MYSARFKAMPDKCPVCGVELEPEPGFYWGAMYISYAFTVGIAVVWGIILYNFFNDPAVPVYLAAIFGTVFVLAPPIIRYSRILMLFLFSPIKYDPKAREKALSSQKK
jgi:RsiW-degrading membrane proteinase PrsW (M82 family)